MKEVNLGTWGPLPYLRRRDANGRGGGHGVEEGVGSG